MRKNIETRNVTVTMPLRLLGDVYLAAAKQNKNIDDVAQVAFEAWLSEVASQAQTGKAKEATGEPPRAKETAHA